MKDRIKALRKQLGKTQEEFAAKLRIKKNNIACYETGKNKPSDAVLELICRTYGVREEWLREGTGEMFVANPYDQELTDFFGELIADGQNSFRTRFVATLRKIPPEYWTLIEQYAKQLIEYHEDKEKD